MRQRKQPANTISDVIVGVGFFTSVLMVLVLPFGAGIGMTFRLFPDSGVRMGSRMVRRSGCNRNISGSVL